MRFGGAVGGGGFGVASDGKRVLVGNGVKNGGRVGSGKRVGESVIPGGEKVGKGAGRVGV